MLTVMRPGVTVGDGRGRQVFAPACQSSRIAGCTMRFSGISRGLVLPLLWTGVAFAQPLPTSARVEAIPLELTMPERYRTTEVLEPIRKVALVAPRDGLVRSIDSRLGALVRDSEEVAQLDRIEAAARLKMAIAEQHEKQALLKLSTNNSAVIQA